MMDTYDRRHPIVKVAISGSMRSDEWLGQLASLEVCDEIGLRADTCEIQISNVPNQKNGAVLPAPPVGTEIQVWLGYEPAATYMGRYRVASWEKSGAPNILSVTAASADLTTEMKARKNRSWHETSVQAIVQKIAAEHGMTATVDKQIGANAIPHLDQQLESDMAFLTRLAKRQGATFKVADGNVYFAAKGSEFLASGKEKKEIIVSLKDVSDWSVRAEHRASYKSAITHYVDPKTNKTVQVTAGSGKPAYRDPRQYGSKSEAIAAGKAAMGDLSRAKLSGNFSMPGNPELFAGALLKLNGFDPEIDGSFLAKRVTHSFIARGYTTSVEIETKAIVDDQIVADG